MTVQTINDFSRTAPVAASGRKSEAVEAQPGESFQPSQPEVVIQSAPITYITPMELTPLASKLPKPVDRIDSIKEVLSVQDAWDLGITGRGIGVAVVDTGVVPHPDLGDRLVAFKDYVKNKDGVENAYDDNGHGSHCAGLVAGDGTKANGRYKGPAFEANIIGVKVLDGQGGGSLANVVKGVQWAIANKDRYNIKVISLSLGAGSNLKEKDDIVVLAVKAALDAGIVPVVAAGNSGPGRETIGTPAVGKEVLTVGAYDDKNTPTHDDDTMAFFSSRGPTTRDKNVKPDIAAPGVNMVSFRSPGSEIDHANVSKLGDYYVLLSGTSMATPVTAGVAALVCQANPDLSPREVIQLMKETAEQRPDMLPILQGAGLVDPGKAVKKALELKKQADAAKAAAPAAPPVAAPAQATPAPPAEAKAA
ncbi:MAG: S8 family peptidase [Candidatus Eremiobacterota bacterium]